MVFDSLPSDPRDPGHDSKLQNTEMACFTKLATFMARQEQEPHGIRIPGQVLDQIRENEERNGEDSRFKNKRKHQAPPVSRKEKRKEERRLKKQKRLKHPQNHNEHVKEGPLAAARKKIQEKKQHFLKPQDDPMAALKALKAKKDAKKEKKSESKSHDDPLAALKALKAKKGKSKPQEIRIVKEDDLGDDDEVSDLDEAASGSDFGEEDEMEGFSMNEDDEVEDPLAALAALKAKKNKSAKDDIRVVSVEDLDDELSSDDLDGEEGEFAEEAEDPEDDGFDNFDEGAFDEEDEDEKDDPIAKLKALKEKKKQKETKNAPEADFVDPMDNDIEYYAKKLGLKDGKKGKLTQEGDGLDDLLDGLDFVDGSAGSDEEGFSDDEELGSEDYDSDSEGPREKENPFVAPTQSGRESESEDEGKSAKYIPPLLRRKMALEGKTESAETLALRKSIKSAINKLSETNIGAIANDINGLFLNHPRQEVNENIVNIILTSIVQQERLLDTFVYLHSALVVALYRSQGADFGAFFVQTLVERYDTLRKEGKKNKGVLNMISLLSSVYAFHLVSSKLLYDLIKELINNLNEDAAELLLKIVRTSGNQMRSDDPTSLKEIVLEVTKKANSLPKEQLTPRMQFLLETITSLKNNKLKNNNDSTNQLALRLKKFLGTYSSSKLTDSLQVSLDDIRNVQTKGKWWLVGSAWKGNEDKEQGDVVNKEVMNDFLDSAEPNWLELAKSQRMNTDIRRAVFISIMSANDYVDAMTKLDKLSLKRAQEREIPRILLHCAVMEPAWNPYYGILASKLCDNHSFRKTFQFMLWDLIKSFDGGADDEDDEVEVFSGFDDDMDDDEKLKKILNLGRLFGYLFAEGSLALHLLRTVNFVTATSDTTLFLEVCLITFVDNIAKKSQINAVGMGIGSKKGSHEQSFDDRLLIERILKAKEQPALLRGIQWFIGKRLRDSDFITGKKQRKRVSWGINALNDIIEEFAREADF